MEGEKEGEESRLQWSLSGTVIDKVVFLCGRDVFQGRIPLREGRLLALVVGAAESLDDICKSSGSGNHSTPEGNLVIYSIE